MNRREFRRLLARRDADELRREIPGFLDRESFVLAAEALERLSEIDTRDVASLAALIWEKDELGGSQGFLVKALRHDPSREAQVLLVELTADAASEVRFAAVRGSGQAADVRRLGEMINDPDSAVAARAAKELRHSGDPGVVGILISHLGDSRPRVRRACAASIASIGDPDGILPLETAVAQERLPWRWSMQAELRRLQARVAEGGAD
ncbi:MAG: HEAT repeat domain-containing protein [Solirubrobacterales bacterium]